MSLSSLEPREIHLEESSDGKKFSVLEAPFEGFELEYREFRSFLGPKRREIT